LRACARPQRQGAPAAIALRRLRHYAGGVKTRAIVLPLALALAWGSTASAVEIEPGQSYRGPVRLEISSIGLSFKLPAGFTGRVGDDGMVLGHASQPGLFFATVRTQVTLQDVLRELSNPIPIDAQTTLQIKGAPKVRKSRVVAHYRGGAGVRGYAVVRHQGQVALAFVGATQSKHMRGLQKMVRALATSVRFGPAKKSSYWQQALGGQTLRRFNTSSGVNSGFTSKATIMLCRNGRFVYRSSSSGFSGSTGGVGVSAAGQSAQAGRWSVSGTQASGQLMLYADGEAEPGVYRLQSRGGRLLVDGERWLRDQKVAAICN